MRQRDFQQTSNALAEQLGKEIDEVLQRDRLLGRSYDDNDRDQLLRQATWVRLVELTHEARKLSRENTRLTSKVERLAGEALRHQREAERLQVKLEGKAKNVEEEL